MKTQEIPANIRSAARLVAGAIRRIKSQQASPQMAKKFICWDGRE